MSEVPAGAKMWKASRRYRSTGRSVNSPAAPWISIAWRAVSSAYSTLISLALMSSASHSCPWSSRWAAW